MDTDEPAYQAHHRTLTGNRFTSEDPAEDDLNQYRYVRNNPLNASDPSGLGSFYRWLYTGKWNASDEVYRAAREESGRTYKRNARTAHKALDVLEYAGIPGALATAAQKSIEALQGPELTQQIRQEVDDSKKSALEKGIDQAAEVAPKVAKVIQIVEQLKAGPREFLEQQLRQTPSRLREAAITSLEREIAILERQLDSILILPRAKTKILREWFEKKVAKLVLQEMRVIDGNAADVTDMTGQELVEASAWFDRKRLEIERQNERFGPEHKDYLAAAQELRQLHGLAQHFQKAAQGFQQNRNLLWNVGKGAEAGKAVGRLVKATEEKEEPLKDNGASEPKAVFRGDQRSAEADAADIQTFHDHVLEKKGDETSRYTSFSERFGTAETFAEKPGAFVGKAQLEELRRLESQGQLKIWTPEMVRGELKSGAQGKKGKKRANDVFHRMKETHELLIEGQVPPGTIRPTNP